MIRLAVTVALLAGPAAAQQQCAPREAIVSFFANMLSQTQQSMALDAAGQLIEVFADLETGQWNMTLTTSDGIACVIGNGDAFEVVEPVPAGVPG